MPNSWLSESACCSREVLTSRTFASDGVLTGALSNMLCLSSLVLIYFDCKR